MDASPLHILAHRIASATSEMEKASALLELAKELKYRDTAQALILAEEAAHLFSLCSETLHEKITAMVLTAECHCRLSHFRHALSIALEALDLAQKINDEAGIVYANIAVGMVYYYLSYYSDALSALQMSLNLAKKLHDKEGIAKSFIALGAVYTSLNKYDEALGMLQQAFELCQHTNDKSNLSDLWNNIGVVYHYLAKYQEALTYFQESLKMLEVINDQQRAAIVLSNIGKSYEKMNYYDEALSYYDKSMNMYVSIGYQIGVANALRSIAFVLLKRRCFEEAECRLKEAIQHYEQLEAKKGLYEALDILAQVYAETGRLGDAYSTLRRARDIEREFFEYNKQQLISNLQVRFEVEQARKEAEIERLRNVELSAALAQAQEERQRADEKNRLLEHALFKIQRLEKIITVCAWTGKIEMDGKWVCLEEFLRSKLGVDVTHGISPEAYQKMMQEIKGENLE